MPVPPPSPSVGSRYPSYTSYSSSYRSPSSSYRATSLDRSSYISNYTSSPYTSSYGSGSSSYSSKYSRPPLPSYSISTDTYRSSRSLRQSPVRPSYSRLTSDSQLESSSSPYRYSSRYSRDSTNRDTSTSRDSGYGSRLSSRDRSVDVINGNSIDTSHFGPSPSSYACNYRWESREKDQDDASNDTADHNGEVEKVRVTDRIRAFESRGPAREVGGLLAGRESAVFSLHDREGGYSPARDSGLAYRRRHIIPITLTDFTPAQTSSTAARKSPSNGQDEDDDNGRTVNSERRPSVTELCRKYDTNHNVTNGLIKQDDDEDASDGSVCSGDPTAEEEPGVSAEASSLRKTRPRATSKTRKERVHSPVGARESTTSRFDSPSRAHRDSPLRNRLESPAAARPGSPSDRDGGRTSPYINGTLDKPKSRLRAADGGGVEVSLSRYRYRQDRVRERIAARLAYE
ncbi:hypothetical protein SK128_005634, partial [Halocaridina rubra]